MIRDPQKRLFVLASLLHAGVAAAQPSTARRPIGDRYYDPRPGWTSVIVALDPERLGADGVSVALRVGPAHNLSAAQVCASGRVVGELSRAILEAAPTAEQYPAASVSFDAPAAVYRQGSWATCVRTRAGTWRPDFAFEALDQPRPAYGWGPSVDLPAGEIEAYDLRAGATVLSWDPARGALVRERARPRHDSREEPGVRLRLSDGRSLESPAWRLYWVESAHAARPASGLAVGDRLRARDGHEVAVESADRSDDHYNYPAFSVTGSGFYFLDGMLVADAPGGASAGAPFVEEPASALVTAGGGERECSIGVGVSPRSALPAGTTDVDVVVARHVGPQGVPRVMSCGQGRVLDTIPRALWDPFVPGAWASTELRPTIHLEVRDPRFTCDYRRPRPWSYDVLLCARGADGRRVALSRVATFGQTTPACLAEGTMVTTVDGPVAIESLVPGQRLAGWDTAAGRAVETRVVRLVARELRPVALVTLADGTTLHATAEHPFWSAGDGRWITARELAPGMTLTRADGTTVRVTARGDFDEGARVFDLSVTAPNDYFANGVLVHNY